MPGFKLGQPSNGIFQHRQPRNVFYDPDALDQLFAHHGWVGLPSHGRPKAVQERIEALEATAVQSLISSAAKAGGEGKSVGSSLSALANGLPEDFGEKLTNSLFGASIVSNETNIVTGKPVEIGKLGIGGKVEYDGATSLVPGFKAPVTTGLRYLGLTRRFKFNMIKDVQVAAAFDHEALLRANFGLMFSGAEIAKPVKIRGMTDAVLKITGGRDKAGGAAFCFSLTGKF